MKNYKYKVTIHVSDTEKTETIFNTREDVCSFLNITPSFLENKIRGKIKRAVCYDIERILIEPDEKEKEEERIKKQEEKIKKQREYHMRYKEKRRADNERMQKEILEKQKATLLEKLQDNHC